VSRSVERAPVALVLALRHFRSARRDAFSSFLSLVAVVGMMLGVAALVLSLAALSGFQAELKSEILARTPEIAIDASSRETADQVVAATWRLPGVRDVQLTRSGLGWIAFRGALEPAELVGFEGDLPVQFEPVGDPGAGLFISDALAREWGLEAGDVVELASASPTLTPFGPQPRVRRLPVRGTFVSGRAEHRLRVALPLIDAAGLLAGDYRILVSTGDLERSADLARKLLEQPGHLPDDTAVRSWKELNRALFFALRLEKAMMFLGVLLIVVVAALALVSNLSLIIANKRREVGMLLALGMQPRTVLASFFALGCGLAATGIVSGAVAGLAGARLLDGYRLLRLPDSVYFLDYVPFLLRPMEIVTVLAVAAAVAILATMYAARGILHLDPVEALRR
jgi:lipoprotein-releasing system permease protein